jgi:translation initiation factor IF-3
MKKYRINYQIKAKKVRLIDENGKHLGIFDIDEALKIAKEKNLDLVEVSPKDDPVVVKIMDFGKFLYEEKKKEKKKKQAIKVIRLSVRVKKHDLENKKNQILKFLNQGKKVKIEMILKGREKMHLDLAQKIFDDFVKSLGEKIKIEKPFSKEEGRLSILISS